MKPVFFLLTSACLAGMISCGKEPASAPAVPSAPARPVSIGDQPAEAAPAPPATDGVPSAATPDASENQRDHAADARMLTQGLKNYVSSKGKLPLNLEELKAAGFIQAIPDPPAGLRWDFDRKKVEVIAAGYAVGL